ncbi:MAG: recombinase family protein [Chloroflexi bacterium]|nr:MAG: recombinase family protein [Chloroflexota bacterium]
MRIRTYTRISTDEDHQPYSLEAQDQRLGAYIQSQEDWVLTGRYTDRMSGSTLDRPDLQRALADARLRRYDLLLVYRVDRVARSVRGLSQILEELDRAQVVFRSATEPFDTATPAGRMMVQLLGIFAEFERATLIDRVINGMERKAARGGFLGGPVPFGYRVQPKTGLLIVDETERPVVELIFAQYVEKRLGTRSVAKWLNERGHRTRAGRHWSHVTVFNVLRHPVYAGRIAFRGNTYDAMHKPLVNLPTFEAAQRLLDERGEDFSKRRTNNTDYMLSGLVSCARCGNHYVGAAAHGRSARYRYYVCFSRQRYGEHGCQADRLPADELDEAILQTMLATYADESRMARAVADACQRAEEDLPQHRHELATVEAVIAKTERAVERYFAAFEGETLSAKRLAGRVAELDERLNELNTRRQELLDAIDHERWTGPTETDLGDLKETIEEAIRAGTPAQRKALLRMLVASITVESREAIHPVFRLPAEPPVRLMSTMVDPVVQHANRFARIEAFPICLP